MSPTHRSALLLPLALLASCAVIRPVDDVVAGTDQTAEVAPTSDALARDLDAPAALPSRDELRAYADEALGRYDERSRRILNEARIEGAEYAALVGAARTLIFNADLRIQAHLAFAFDPADLPEPEVLIDAEDDVPSALKGEVRSLADSSRKFADAALERREGDAAGRLFSTLGLGLYLWSLGPLEALASGAATTLPNRIKALANDEPGFEGASPLRLKGRLQSRAPWPYKDRPGAVETLTRAVELAPIPLNLLFLGDAHWLNGDEDAAREAWSRATRATADEETRDAAPLLREIARLRLLAAASPQS